MLELTYKGIADRQAWESKGIELPTQHGYTLVLEIFLELISVIYNNIY